MSIAYDIPSDTEYLEVFYEGHTAVFVPAHTDFPDLAERWIAIDQDDLVDVEDNQ